MSNLNKDQPSIRVFAPPGGRSTNIFGVPEPEMPISTKKNHMESDIFGCKKLDTHSSPVKPARTVTNNIYGSDPDQPAPKSSVYSGKNKSTIFDEAPPMQPSTKPDRQRSTIFANEPAQATHSNRPVSEKYKSNIFGTNDDDQQKRQTGTRQGLRVGYNPINGEPYESKDDVTKKMEEVVLNEEENGEKNTTDNEQTPLTDDQPTKNGHTSVRVVHPPGGRSNGPLW